MSRFRTFIKPFNANGSYADDWIEVTEDTDFNSLSSITETIDASDFEVGIFKFNSFSVRLNNIKGNYSDIGTPNTIFNFKRSDSQFKIIWEIEDDLAQCGNSICGNVYTNIEKEIFSGLLNDESLTSNIRDQKVNFQVLGLESVFDKEETPFSSLSNGQTISQIIYILLNQVGITELMTVDALNINPDYDVAIDDISDLENTTVKEALDLLLGPSNSVLYIKDQVIYVSNFDATVDVKKTFYGQGSQTGIEDIQDIQNIRSGANKTFNFWTWDDTSLVIKDESSISLYGTRKNIVGINLITDNTKRNNILSNLLAEYQLPKQSFEMTVPINYDSLELFMLDRIEVDYAVVYRSPDGENIRTYGLSKYGEARYPLGDFAFSISPLQPVKILERRVDIKKQVIKYKVREI